MRIEQAETMRVARLSAALRACVRTPTFWAILIIVSVVIIALYGHYRSLGFYEDDIDLYVQWLDLPLSQLPWHVRDLFTQLPQGRPFQFVFLRLAAMAAGKLNDPLFGYVFGAGVICMNGTLAYFLFRRVTKSTMSGFIGALVLVLFPADTTQGYVMHAIGLQPAMSALLIASLIYLGEKRTWLAYPIAFFALITYESPFPVFLVVVFLKSGWRWRDVVTHVSVLVAMMIGMYVVRTLVGDSRVLEIEPLEVIYRVVTAIFLGPAVSLSVFVRLIPITLQQLNLELAAVFIVGAVGITALIRRLPRARVPFSVFVVALLAMMSAYLVSFTHYPPTTVIGRETSVHFAAAFGGGLLAAYLVSLLPPTWGSAAVVGVFFGIIMMYRVTIQWDLARNWTIQQDYWRQVVALTPDLQEGTVVLVSPNGLPSNEGYMLTQSFNDAQMIRFIFRIPNTWREPPRVIPMRSDMRFRMAMTGDEGEIKWLHFWTFPIQNGNVIYLEMVDGRLQRPELETIQVGNDQIRLKPRTDPLMFPIRPYYTFLIGVP